ncbi:MAG: caspase family protein, partial [Kofleriaceae bacterium]
MRKRSLIVRPDYQPLSGFENGAACIAQLVQARGFEIDWCQDANATRDGILAALRRLIDDSRDDDAVAIYYVGHGGITSNRNYTPDDTLPRYIQHICPTDFGQTSDDDFRGISTFELSLQLAALTRKTTNVTVILECCYAAQLVRGDEPASMQRIKPKLTRVGLTRHLQELRARSNGLSALDVMGNPFAVRIAASGQTDSAYQLPLPPGDVLRTIGVDLPAEGWIGGMTLRLAQILAETRDAQVSWRAISSELHARLVVQRPEIEGPVSRLPFSLATVEAGAYPVHLEHGVATLEAGRMLGVSTGDVYGVVPAGTTRLDPTHPVPEVTIGDVSAMRSWSRRISWPGTARTLPASAVALPKSLELERYAVRVVADEPAVRSTLEAALQRSKRVRLATSRDTSVLADLRIQAGALVLFDEQGPLFPPAAYPARVADAVKDLENLATERRLRSMSGDEGLIPTDVAVQILVLGS